MSVTAPSPFPFRCLLLLGLLLGTACHGSVPTVNTALLSAAPAGAPRDRVAHFQVGTDMPLIYYGPLDYGKADQIRQRYKLVVLQPTQATAPLVRYIQAGPDGVLGTADDVIVLGYFSAGEDLRTKTMTNAQLPKGDGSGPRVDPRPGAPFPNGNPDMTVSSQLGLPSPGGTGYASYYLDDDDRNGIPDRNQIFGACFVNAGDPAWFTDSMNMTAAKDQVSGLQEIMTTTSGAGLGCDGVMLDTFDTPAPNSWTTSTSPNNSKFEWTASGFQTYLQRVRQAYPDKVLVINRGTCFFNPDLGEYKFCPVGLIDLFMFESFYSDSDPTHPTTPFWNDNRAVYAVRLNAEADRPGGFKVITLGYKTGTLAQEISAVTGIGWFPALSDASVDWLQTLIPDQTFPARQAPTWDSTYYSGAWNAQPQATPRVGIQQAVLAGTGQVTVRWDVANAMLRPIHYNLYYQAGTTLDFATATRLLDIPPAVGQGYINGTGPTTYPYQFTVIGLATGSTYTFAIRAQDAGNPPLEEQNTATLSVAVP